jgi:hemoglobin
VRESLYERLGGEAAIMAAATRFYERVLADPTVNHFFEGVNMEVQTRKLVGFMAWAFGGPDALKGRDLRAAHAALVKRGLGDVHFDAIAKHLSGTLADLGVADDLAREALTIVAGTREEVLGR